MQETYTVVDMAAWKRTVHCQVFREYVEPSYCVTVELDVTHFLGRVRSSGYSFTFSMVHLVTSCAQEIEEFRYRFLDGRVVLYRKINTACTYLDEQSDLFKVVYVPMQDSLPDYLAEAAARVKAQKEYFTGPLANDVFQFSPMPWLSYTHISPYYFRKEGCIHSFIRLGQVYGKGWQMAASFLCAGASFVCGWFAYRKAR